MIDTNAKQSLILGMPQAGRAVQLMEMTYTFLEINGESPWLLRPHVSVMPLYVAHALSHAIIFMEGKL